METYRKDNICNICKNESPCGLSNDHVPPKGGINVEDMFIGNYNNFSYQYDHPKQTIQNGIKFKTICRKCNSMLSKYDRAFNDLTLYASYIVRCPFVLPKQIIIRTYPTKVIKSVLSHLLAAKLKECDMMTDQIVRDYVLGRVLTLPEHIRIFTWFHPYNMTIIKNDLLQINNDVRVHYSILKFFPLAFAVSFDNKILDNTTEITNYNNNIDEQELEILMYLNHFPPFYPENIDYVEFQLSLKNNYGVFGIPKNKHK